MRLRATAILGSSSVVSIVVGVVSAKAWALLVGPVGVGQLGLLQALVAALTIVAGFGTATALVRRIAAATEIGDTAAVTASIRAATLLVVVGGSVVAVILAFAQAPLATLILGSAAHAPAIVLAGIALVAGLLSSVQLAVLNGLRRLRPLAVAGALVSVAGAVASIAILVAMGRDGVQLAVPAAALAGLVVSLVVRRLAVRVSPSRPPDGAVLGAVRSMIAFGGPYTASMMIGTGVQLALPVVVLARLGVMDVGYFRAAATVSVAYLGFLLSTLSQDYYPRLAAVAHQPEAVATALREQLRLVLALGTPVIFAAVGLAGLLIPLLYSAEFAPAADLLRWQLSADVLRLPSWCFGFVLLAQGRTRAYFVTELIAGVCLVVFVSVGIELFGLEGAGMGSIAAYIVYYPLVAAVATRGLRMTALSTIQPVALACLPVAVGIAVLPRVGLGAIQEVVGVAAAIVAAALSVRAIRASRRTADARAMAREVPHVDP